MLYSQTIFAIILAIAPAVLGHSWIEQIMVVGEDGSLPQAAGDLKIGESQPVGFPRNNSLRDASFNENRMVHKILEVSDKAPICGPSQSKPFQSAGSPILKASPGDMVALLYQENGHVTISPDPAGTGFMPFKAKGSGTVFIYGTTDPKPDDKLFSIWKKWNADGSGGDKRGFLLATRDYDDGQCHQDNMGKIASERRAKQNSDMTLFCQNDFTIPDTAKPGSLLTVYWVWQWDNMKAPELTETQNVEMYTTCMDIEIVEGKGTSKNLKFNDATPIHKRAIKEQLTNSFTSSNPVEGTTGGQSSKLPGPIPDQANGKERLPTDGSSPAPVADPPVSAEPKPEQKPSPSAQPSVSVPVQSDAPKATVTVTVEKPGPAQFVTVTETESVLVAVTVGQSLTLGKKPDASATSGAASSTASSTASPSIPTTLATVASLAASSSASSAQASLQASASAAAGDAGARPVVEGFLNAEASIITPTPSSASPSTPSSISAPTASVVADITTASPPVPATTSTPTPSPVEEPLQIITEEATITEYETIVTSFVKPSSTESAEPILETPAGVNNGTVAARAAKKDLPRFRRLRRAL